MELTFLQTIPVFDTRLTLEIEALTPLSMVTAQVGFYFQSEETPTPGMLYGMLENMLGLHLDKALRQRVVSTLKRTGAFVGNESGFVSLLQQHVRLEIVSPEFEPPKTEKFADLWSQNLHGSIMEVGGSRHHARGVAALLEACADKRAEVTDRKGAVPYVEGMEFPPGGKVLIQDKSVTDYFPYYYQSPKQREYVIPEQPYRVHLYTNAALAARLAAAVEDPAAFPYLGTSEGWVDVRVIAPPESASYAQAQGSSELDAAIRQATTHPYSRYGFAIALHKHDSTEEWTPERVRQLTPGTLKAALIRAIEHALDYLRLRTSDKPRENGTLTYQYVQADEILNDRSLLAKKAQEGHYPPTTLLMADKQMNTLWEPLFNILEQLKLPASDLAGTLRNRAGKPAPAGKSFAPFTAKLNAGIASLSAPKISLLEAACCLIATITPLKPAVLHPDPNDPEKKEKRWGLFPDLPLFRLLDYVYLIDEYLTREADAPLFVANARTEQAEAGEQTESSETGAEAVGEDEIAPAPKGKANHGYRRPPLSRANFRRMGRGNWSDAIQLLIGLGEWEKTAKQSDLYEKVVPYMNKFYMVHYDKVQLETYGDVVTKLAAESQLYRVLQGLEVYTGGKTERSRDSFTQIYGLKLPPPGQQTESKDNTIGQYYFFLNRFLQRFNRATFTDFIATRARYGTGADTLLRRYLMENTPLTEEQIASSDAIGRWIATSVYRMSKADATKDGKTDWEKQRENSYKLMLELESFVLTSKNITQIMWRIARTLQVPGNDGIPEEGRLFINAARRMEPNGFLDARFRNSDEYALRLQSPVQIRAGRRHEHPGNKRTR